MEIAREEQVIKLARAIMVERRAALLMRCGGIKDVDVVNPVIFYDINRLERYHNRITHRYHIDIMIALKITCKNILQDDFAVVACQAFGSAQQKGISTGAVGMFAGDMMTDAVIQATYFDKWKSQLALNLAYNVRDINLDGVAKALEYNLCRGNPFIVAPVEVQY